MNLYMAVIKDERYYMRVRFKISEENFYNNGKIILESLSEVEDKIREALSQEEEIDVIHRQSKRTEESEGINAKSLNDALRKCLKPKSIKGETHVENGVFFHTTNEGFDFSVYDEEYNLSRLFNYYIGTIGVRNGDVKIAEIYQKMGYGKEEWKGKIEEIRSKVGPDNDYIVDKKILTTVGELQFGNWALIYRELFRLLDADSKTGIDFYIYVTADDALSKLLSAGTVSFKRAKEVIGTYLSIIKTPIWLVGLGIERV